MRITGFRTLTTIQEWGRPVGDANGVFDDGVRPDAAGPGEGSPDRGGERVSTEYDARRERGLVAQAGGPSHR